MISIPFDVPPYRLSGTVYAVLLNHRSTLAMLGDAASAPPYGAPPRSPVLSLKPRNTLAGPGQRVLIPADAAEVEVAANVGVVIGRPACRVAESAALAYLAGYLMVADVSLPVPNHFRPAVRYRARDGFCPLGPAVIPAGAIDPDALTIRVSVDGSLVQTAFTADLVRSTARLIADVTEFMTLSPGDVLALGAASPAPRVRPGQSLAIQVEGLGALQSSFEAERP